MDKEEENKYVSQLLGVFNSCDTTGTGYLDKEELTDLCHKLHLDAQLPLLLQTLLGTDIFARVNFEEFKEGFVAVLSSTIDISISEDESSYLEPVIPDEVKPKYVKGTKRYGRRTQPEREAAENEANKCLQEQHQVKGQRKSQLKRSSSLESVESLKSDEEAENGKEPLNENFEAQGQLRAWNPEIFDGRRRNLSPCSDMTEHQVRDIWEELGVGHNGYLNQQELATVCKNIGLKDLSKEELEDLFNKLDRDGDGRVSFQEFQDGLFSHAPVPISSTPLKNTRPWACFQPVEDSSRMTTTNSLLSAFGGLHLFSTIDDGTGFGSPEQIMIIWEEEGIEDGKEILTSLDFSLGERVNLLDLTTALDNELIATKNRIHMAALASYKNELYHQHGLVEQVTRERDKVKQDFEKAEKRNLQLANEVDDHNSEMEQLNESKIKDLELEYRQRLSVLRTELESEKEQFIHQADQHKTKLESDLANLKIEEAALRERLNLSVKENSRLQKEMVEVVEKLSEAENDVVTLQTNVEDMLKGKRQSDHPHMEFCNQDERFADIINEYEIQCRELRDQNDELQIQLETLRSQLSESKYSRLLARIKDNKLLHLKAKEKIHNNSLSNGSQGKKGMSTKLRRSASAAGANGPVAMEPEPPPVNIEAELTKQQLKEQQQEIQDLKIELETKVNYYEREVELMKSNFEKERKATEHSFKLEISELEEQKADLEELNAKYQEVIDGLKVQLSKSAQCQEMEKRFKEEKFELEQYYAKEISALGQRLTAEKDQLEEELRRTHQHELQSMRMELCRLTEDNGLLRNKLEGLQKEVHDFEDQANKHRKEVEHLKKEKEKLVCELEELNKQSQKYQEEARLLNAQSLQLSNAILDLTAQNKQNQETMQQLSSSLRDMAQQKEEAAASVTQLQEMMCRLEQANVQQEAESQGQRDQLEKDLQRFKDENQKYQDELHRLNAQTLQLNASVADLSAWKMEKQETLQNLTSQLRDVTQREEAEQAEGTRLHKVLSALEREKDRLEHELDVSKEECQKYREELRQLNTQSLQLSSSVSDLSVQHSGNQEVIQQLNNRLREVTKQKEDAAAVVEQLKDVLNTLEREKLQHLAAWQQERNQLAQELRTSNEKMENHTQKHMREKEGLLSGLHESNKQLVIMDSLQEEVTSLRQEKQSLGEQCHSLTSQLKDVAAQVMKMHKLERDLKVAHEESQTLKRNQAQLRETLAECQDQLLEANSKLTLEQSQHMRQVQQLKEQVSCAVPMEQVTELQNRLREEEQNSLQLQDKMRFHAEQTNRLLAMQQEEHEKLLRRMEERLEEVEMDLKNVRLMLQEKVNQLKEQLEKNAKSGLLLKDLYVENAQLMKALQVTEQRQKSAEKKNYLLEEKISALNKVIGRIAPASLAV
uniref:Ninein-like protein n=1 Tax=Xenopus laevis TaxID=8355 RepID=B7ZS31_XENLA|nr:Nlp protein [Xenopus laevis]